MGNSSPFPAQGDQPGAARFRHLLPASFQSAPEWKSAPVQRRKRPATTIACSSCQKAKAKCNGVRPVCYRCTSRDIACEYNVGARLSRASSKVRQVVHVTTDENLQLRELLTYLRTRPWAEAVEILRRIRGTQDPLEVIQVVKDADLVLQQSHQPFRRHPDMIPQKIL